MTHFHQSVAMEMAHLTFKNGTPNSVSATDDLNACMTFDVFNNVPLLGWEQLV